MNYVLRNMCPYIVSNHGIFLAWLDNKQRRYQGKTDKNQVLREKPGRWQNCVMGWVEGFYVCLQVLSAYSPPFSLSLS